MSSTILQQWLAGATLLVALGAIFVVSLRSAKYTLPFALLVSALVLLQPPFCNYATTLKADVFAAVVYAVALTAISLIDQQDVRRIALLGGSLAGAQLVHPLWGATATIMLPFALRNKLEAGSMAGLTGLYISILFVPVLMAAALFSFDASFRSEILSIARVHPDAHFALRRTLDSIASVLIAAAPILVAVAVRPQHPPVHVIVAIALTLILVCLILQAFALQFATLTVGFGVLMIPLFGGWQASGKRVYWAVGLSLTNIFAAWASHLVQANA